MSCTRESFSVNAPVDPPSYLSVNLVYSTLDYVVSLEMQRNLVVFLLVSVVLFCPYLCLADSVGAAYSQAIESRCGRCCDEGKNNAPQKPLEGEPDCLCNGAILDGARIESRDASAAKDAAVGVPTYTFVMVLCTLSHDATLPPHFPPLKGGRDICLFVSSFLL